jgi:hypothetical protein
LIARWIGTLASRCEQRVGRPQHRHRTGQRGAGVLRLEESRPDLEDPDVAGQPLRPRHPGGVQLDPAHPGSLLGDRVLVFLEQFVEVMEQSQVLVLVAQLKVGRHPLRQRHRLGQIVIATVPAGRGEPVGHLFPDLREDVVLADQRRDLVDDCRDFVFAHGGQ